MRSENYYNQNAQSFYEGTVNADMSESYKPFLELVKEGGHILDAGCGSGRDSLYFLNNGYKVTAIDASDAMVDLASKLTNQKAINMHFQEIDFVNEFDGIWACASLLHVNREEIHNVLERLSQAIKTGGVLFTSFKYGDMEVERDDRYFNCYDEVSFSRLIEAHPELKIKEIKKTMDVREGRENEYWLSALIIKR
jgi:SAM-dependent methyltransferase